MPPRGHRPLFDLIPQPAKEQRGGTRLVVAPPPREPREVAPLEVHVPEAEPTPARGGLLEAVLGHAVVRVRANLIYATVALIPLLLVAAWWGGVRWGEAKAQRDLAQFRMEPVVNDPQANVVAPPKVSPPKAEPTRRVEAPKPEPSKAAEKAPELVQGGSNPTPAKGPGMTPVPPDATLGAPPEGRAILTAKGWLLADPREEGKNYYAMGIVRRQEGERAVAFFAENGLEVIGEPLDVGGGGANNADPRYRLFALAGITGEEFSQKRTARTNLEATVARLGQVWKQERRGTTDFAQGNWEKFR